MTPRPLFVCTLLSCLFACSGLYGAEKSTLIESQRLEMVTTDAINTFYFYGDVHVAAEALDTRCDEMMVITRREAKEHDSLGDVGAIAKIVAQGHVVIDQKDRVARADKAEIFPDEGKVVLSGNPSVTDAQGVVRGYQIVLDKDERKAKIIGSPDGGRPSVTLPMLPEIDPKKPVQKTEEKTLAQLDEENS